MSSNGVNGKLRVPELGSVEWTSVYGIVEQIEIGLKHVDGKTSRAWGLSLLQFRLREQQRIAELRKGTTRETHPYLYVDRFETPEGATEYLELALDVLAQAVAGVRGLEGVAEDDHVAAMAFLDRLSAAPIIVLMGQALAQQGLPDSFRAPPPSDRVLSPGGSA